VAINYVGRINAHPDRQYSQPLLRRLHRLRRLFRSHLQSPLQSRIKVSGNLRSRGPRGQHGEWSYSLLQVKTEEVAEDNHEDKRKMGGATRHFEVENVAFYACGYSLVSSVETAGALCR
jgi:hypothetical protein